MAATSNTSLSGEQSTCMRVSSDSDNEHEETESLSSGSGLCSGISMGVAMVSLLSRLKSSSTSDLGRKRKIASNPPTGKRQSHGSTANEPKNIHPSQRVKEFPSEPLKVNHLFCYACREELSLKSSSLHNHFQSSKHIEGKKRLDRKKPEKDLAEAFKRFNAFEG